MAGGEGRGMAAVLCGVQNAGEESAMCRAPAVTHVVGGGARLVWRVAAEYQ